MRQFFEKETKLLGLRIHSFSFVELSTLLEAYLTTKESLIVYGFSANIYSRIRKLPEFISFFNRMDIIIADGQGIPILAKRFNVDIKERIGIVNLSNYLLQLASKRNYKVYLLGGTEESNKNACKNIIMDFPLIGDCRGRNGYFTDQEESRIVEDIKNYGPHILYIGMSSPLKEKFAIKYKNELNARLIIPCGGWIDVMAGKVKRPPLLFKKLPITWIFRFIQEPKRMFGPIILSVLDTVFIIFPALYFKHLLGIEKNPSIISHFKLENKLQQFEQ